MIQRIVLGSILLDQSVHDMVMPILKADYFDEKHRYLYEIMAKMYHVAEPIDNITVYKHIGKNGKWTALEVAQLTNGIASAANVMAYVQELKNDYVRRQLNLIAGLNIPEIDDPGEPLAEIIRKLTQLQEEQVIGTEQDIVDIAWKALNELHTEKQTTGMVGVPTPSGRINSDTRGLRKGELIILAGRPGMGKTAFALSIVRTACEAGKKVAYFSLEMRSTELAKRFIRSFGDDETGAGVLSTWKIHLFDRGGIDVNYIRSNVRLLKDCDLVVVDYLGLLRMNPYLKRSEAIGEVSRSLKAFALESDLPILLLSQLNRDSEERGGVTHRLSDLRESGDIEQDADKVFFITRPGMIGSDKMKNPDDRSIMVQKEKDRNGQAPKYFKLVTDYSFTNFYDESDMPRETVDYQSRMAEKEPF